MHFQDITNHRPTLSFGLLLRTSNILPLFLFQLFQSLFFSRFTIHFTMKKAHCRHCFRGSFLSVCHLSKVCISNDNFSVASVQEIFGNLSLQSRISVSFLPAILYLLYNIPFFLRWKKPRLLCPIQLSQGNTNKIKHHIIDAAIKKTDLAALSAVFRSLIHTLTYLHSHKPYHFSQ